MIENAQEEREKFINFWKGGVIWALPEFAGTHAHLLINEWNEDSHDLIDIAQADGYGVFLSVQAFSGPERKAENVTKFLGWGIDIDGDKAGSKESQLKLIDEAPLLASAVVETSSGYHVWFRAEEGETQTPEEYKKFLNERLIPYFKADTNAKDISRVLRLPGTMHMKDPDPEQHVYCPIVRFSKARYTLAEMTKAFPVLVEPQPKRPKPRAGEFSAMDLLEVISGSWIVANEEYTFSRNGDGTFQICIKGAGPNGQDYRTSTWIDQEGLIGSKDGGGPFVTNWIMWYARNRGTGVTLEKAQAAVRKAEERCREKKQNNSGL